MCVCVAATYAGAHWSKREAAVIFISNHTLGTPLLCVYVCTQSHIFVTFVCDCLDCVCVCVHTLCVCVCKALGSQAAWWRCRWDNIWHVSDWVSVYTRVCVCECLCLCISVHLGSPPISRGSLCSLWPHWGAGGTRERERESSEACLPSASLTSTNSHCTVAL